MAQRIRTIVESESFVRTREALQISAKRWDEIMEGAGTALSRRPQFFPQVPYTKGLRSLRTEKYSHESPSYIIWFRFNDREVELVELSFAFPEDGDERGPYTAHLTLPELDEE